MYRGTRVVSTLFDLKYSDGPLSFDYFYREYGRLSKWIKEFKTSKLTLTLTLFTFINVISFEFIYFIFLI